MDFREVLGLPHEKRILEVAAVTHHWVLFCGPGPGRDLAQAVADMEGLPFVAVDPQTPDPVEAIEDAQEGILYLDQIERCAWETLEAIFAQASSVMVIGRGDTCPCGKWGVEGARCLCAVDALREHYRRVYRIAEYFDLVAQLPAQGWRDLQQRPEDQEPASAIRRRVEAARAVVVAHQPTWREGIAHDVYALLEAATRVLGLTLEQRDRILRVARSVAALEGDGTPRPYHVSEALQYSLGFFRRSRGFTLPSAEVQA